MLRRLLPRPLARRLAAVVPAKLAASEAEILQATLDVEGQIERKTEERVLQELLDLVGPGGRATLGLVPTLDALWADMVQTLVVAQNVCGAGSECPNCGRLEPGSVETCPACGKAMGPLHDLFHRAMVRAREQAGSVEVMHGAAARQLQDVERVWAPFFASPARAAGLTAGWVHLRHSGEFSPDRAGRAAARTVQT